MNNFGQCPEMCVTVKRISRGQIKNKREETAKKILACIEMLSFIIISLHSTVVSQSVIQLVSIHHHYKAIDALHYEIIIRKKKIENVLR